MSSIRLIFGCVLAAFSVPANGQGSDIERRKHDHSVFVLSGEPSQLEHFHAEVGSDWEGGVLLERNEAHTVYRYWAFEWRTAPQSRAFIMPAMFAGLQLEFSEYDDGEAHPKLRQRLDEALSECDAARDPFLILPTGVVDVSFTANPPDQSAACVLGLVQDARRHADVKFAFLGNERAEAEDDE